MKYAIYAYYLNSDGTKSGYLVECGNSDFLDLDKYTYAYCQEKITWSFEWLEITFEADNGQKIQIKKTYNEMQRKGGQSTSEAKRKASAENGKKGGRPRKKIQE
jgi:hypothetical protein